MVVRILWLKEHDLETWDQVNKLLHHVDNNKEEDKITTSIIYFIHNICNLTQFTEEDILVVIGNLWLSNTDCKAIIVGILDTNGYIIGTNITRDVHLQGLFPVNSLINHSCRANTMCYAPSDQVCSSPWELLLLIINTDILSCIVNLLAWYWVLWVIQGSCKPQSQFLGISTIGD